MKARFSPPSELELKGDASELGALKLQLEDGANSILRIGLEPHDPHPYDLALEFLTIHIAEGPTRIEVTGTEVSIAGARENIERFASFLAVRPGRHAHYDRGTGEEWVDEGSMPIVISCASN